jgi:hypothetical protein
LSSATLAPSGQVAVWNWRQRDNANSKEHITPSTLVCLLKMSQSVKVETANSKVRSHLGENFQSRLAKG